MKSDYELVSPSIKLFARKEFQSFQFKPDEIVIDSRHRFDLLVEKCVNQGHVPKRKRRR